MSSLLNYWERTRPRNYSTAWFHRHMCAALERAYRQRRNVIFELPPRHSKSELVNVYAPGWWLETNYDYHFGLIANSDSLAQKFCTATRAKIVESGRTLSIDQNRQFKIAANESLDSNYFAAGIRGQMTGRGFDTVVFDDLLKSGTEAKSETVRETVFENVVSAALNRLSPQGNVIALQARLHQDDTIGRLLTTPLAFDRLHLPATNDDGQSAWFKDGVTGEIEYFPAYSALWPERYPREKLDEIRGTVASYYWLAQYQQEPSLGDLAYFDVSRFGTYQSPQVDQLWIAVDAANTATVNGSYTAFVCLGIHESSLKVLGVRRGRWRQDRMCDELVEFHAAMSRLTGLRPSSVIVEQAAGGYGIIDYLGDRLPIEPIYPKGSKEDRAGAVCHVVNKGAVLLPESAPWVKPFRDEIGNFPLSSFKDQVDAFVHALSYAVRPSEFKPVQQIVEYDPMLNLQLDSFKGLDEADLLDSQWNRRGDW